MENRKLIMFRDGIKKTQREMAEMLDISLSFYIKIEHGIRNPSYNFLVRFKEVFPGEDVDEIFFSTRLHAGCGKPTGTAG